jgi:hypothetical protein
MPAHPAPYVRTGCPSQVRVCCPKVADMYPASGSDQIMSASVGVLLEVAINPQPQLKVGVVHEARGARSSARRSNCRLPIRRRCHPYLFPSPSRLHLSLKYPGPPLNRFISFGLHIACTVLTRARIAFRKTPVIDSCQLPSSRYCSGGGRRRAYFEFFAKNSASRCCCSFLPSGFGALR